MTSLKDQRIDFDKIVPAVKNAYFNAEIKHIKQTEYHLFIVNNESNSPEKVLRVYKKLDGRITLDGTPCSDKELAKEVSDLILQYALFGGADTCRIPALKVSDEIEQGLYGYLVEVCDAKLLSEDTTPLAITRKWRGTHGDQLTIKKHLTTGRLQFQGKNLYLSNMAVDYFRSALPESDAICLDIDNFKLPCSKDDAITQFNNSYPFTFSKMPEIIRKQLIAAHILRATNLPLEDFTFICHPAMRSLETFIKHMLGKRLPEHVSLSTLFEKNGSGNSVLKDKCGTQHPEWIERAFKFYNDRRHRVFHANYFADSTVILAKEDAVSLNAETLDFFEEMCATL